MAPELTQEELAATLDRCTEELLWELEIGGPPIDAFVIAERLGVRVAESRGQHGRARFARFARGASGGAAESGLILLAEEPRPERRHWAVAHEIGECLAHRVFDRLGVLPQETPTEARESVANGFAGRLLLPRRWFLVDADGVDWDLPAIKNIYPTASHELIARRFLELFPGPAIVTVLDQGRTTWRRSNYSAPAPERDPEEFACWEACHHLGEPMEAAPKRGGVCRVRCWPVHEPGWRREVMLTELQPAW